MKLMNNINLSRYLIVFALLLGMASTAHAQDDAIAKYFQKYMDREDFTTVYISPRMFRMFSNKENREEVDNALGKLNGLRILASDSLPMGRGIEMYKEAMNIVGPKPYEELMRIKDGDENVNFYVLDSDNPGKVKELLMLVGGESSFFLMSITGNISLDEISEIADDMDIDGLDQLEHLDKKKNKNR